MSIYKIINRTTQDLSLDWLDGYILAPNVPFDLMDKDLSKPEKPYFNREDFIGCLGGHLFEKISIIIKSGQVVFSDGDMDYCIEMGLYVLKWGSSPFVNSREIFTDNKYVAFTSHNFADPDDWSGNPVFSIAPTEDKILYLKGAKVIFTQDCVIEHGSYFYFKIFIGENVVSEVRYYSFEDLMMGCRRIELSPQVGDPSTTGAAQLVHVYYKYVEPIKLYWSLGMRIDIGFSDGSVLKGGKVLKMRVEAIPVNE